jgi:hypothetical protein
MKTRLILIAVITIIGISLFSAFKQSEGSKKYLTMTVSSLSETIIITDENGGTTEKEIKVKNRKSEWAASLTIELNNISIKGYKLIETVGISSIGGKDNNLNHITQYIFEKE